MSLQDEINIQEAEVNTQTEWLRELKEMQAKLLAKEVVKPKSKRGLRDARSSYGLNSSGDVFQYFDGDFGLSNDNAFIDEESAKLQAQRNILVHKMRIAALDSPVDWSDHTDKHYTAWNYTDRIAYFHFSNFIRVSQLPHFSCESKLKSFMRPLSTDEQKLLICGVE
jgi:hypothetical protein